MKNDQSNTPTPSCWCAKLSDLAVVDMGDESERFLLSLEQIKKRGNPYWWLAVYRCRNCKRSWLLGQESRINDVYCLYRLGNEVMEDLLINDHWPTIFDHYEDLLRIGLEAGKKVHFLEPLKAKSLRWTMFDLAMAKPGISIAEIAVLLHLDPELAKEIARKVIQEDGASISFGGVK